MTTPEGVTISERAWLNPEELAETLALKARCDALEGLDLKLSYGATTGQPDLDSATTVAWLARAGDELVGYCCLEGDGQVGEVCAMVHPEWRRRRLGLRFFEVARARFTERGGEQLFAVCEDGSESGRWLMRMLAGQRAFTERRMLLRDEPPAPTPPRAPGACTVTRALPDEYAALGAALGPAFDQPPERFVEMLGSSVDDGDGVYIARVDGQVVGGFRLSPLPDTLGIYGFGIDPARQRQGWGRLMLAAACAEARARGATRVTLEVDDDNERAIALYTSAGFETITTYGYYIFSRTLLTVGFDEETLTANADRSVGGEERE